MSTRTGSEQVENRRRAAATVLLLVSLAFGCGRDEAASDGGPRAAAASPAASRAAAHTPSAQWLAEPSSPLKVTITAPAEARSAERKIGVGGGELRLNAGENRITLTFPPEALARSQEITMTAVAVEGLPFERGAIVAVRIEPEDVLLRRAPVLRIQSRGEKEGDLITGFAVRDGEMNLYPVGAVDELTIEMLPGTLGTFGIADVSSRELAAGARHVPSDLLARLEQRIAVAFAPAGVLRASAAIKIPLAFMQFAPQPVSPPAAGHSNWLQQLLESIRDAYNDVVVPGFEAIPKDDCLSPALWKAIEAYTRWDSLNQLLLPVQKDAALMEYPAYQKEYHFLVDQRLRMLRERGFTDQQIEEINREIEKYRQNFEEFSQRIKDKILEEMRNAFVSLHRCCMTQRPLQYHLDTMVSILRAAALFGDEELVPDPWPKLNECACRVAAAAKGAPEAFYGTIMQTETLKIDETKTSAGGAGQMKRTRKNTQNLEYSMTLHVLRPLRGNSMYAEASARGTDEQWSLLSDDWGVCKVEREQRLNAEGRAEDQQVINLHLHPKEKQFNVSFGALPVEGSGRVRDRYQVSGSGCNPFQVKRSFDKSEWRDSIIPGSNVDIVDAQYDPESPFLRGSRQLEGERRGGVRTIVELKWDLRRCGK